MRANKKQRDGEEKRDSWKWNEAETDIRLSQDIVMMTSWHWEKDEREN